MVTVRPVGVEFRGLNPGESPTVHVKMSDGTEQVWISGELPGRAAELGRILGAPVRIAVKACGDCPFSDASSDMAYQCTRADGRVAVSFSDENAPNRPDWCPLELGPVTVEVEK